ncbi:MAG: DegT/DnrJ/EryC1/StrS family aminotransferase [Candidatus Omnitrophica bacterium]|nr:DegT/DnrJ/EryC1/StrS family aminotransferase [Candidatus Omnitrophota bacterium]
MRSIIPHLRPWITQSDIKAVNSALLERCTSHFKYADSLSAELAKCAGFKNCNLYASGTLALRTALLMLKLPKGSGVAIPAFTCRGVLTGVLAAGHRPYVADCDDNGLMNADEVLKAHSKGRVVAAVAVHQFGLVNESMEKPARSMPVIEDCSHVPPKAYIKNSKSIFGSLEGTKLLGAGEGGYLLFDGRGGGHKKIADPAFLGNRLSDIMAVLALCQLKRLSENVENRKRTAGQYRRLFDDSRVVDGKRAAWLRFLIRMDSLNAVAELIRKAGIRGITLRRPIMPYPLHRYLDAGKFKCPNAERLWKTLVSIPIFPDMTNEEISAVKHFLRYAEKKL